MKTYEFRCDDSYEAEKLAGIVSVQRDGTVWVSAVTTLIGNEIVIQLKDKSSHAVLLKSARDAAILRDFLSKVVAGIIVIRKSSHSGSVAEVIVD